MTADLSLLDKNLDDIEELPGFETPVNGVYTLKLNTSVKVVNNKTAVEAAYELIECQEQDNPEEVPTKVGTKFSQLFFLENEIALSNLKKLLKPVSEHFGTGNLNVLVNETCKDLVVAAKVKRRPNKENPDAPYADVSHLTVA